MLRWQRRLGAAGIGVLLAAASGCGSSSAPATAAGADGAAIPQCAAQGADATVVGPIAAATPGSAAHDYPWLASDLDLAGHGYVEEEYFFCGTAPLGSYTTRMVVRRPRRAADANGAVLAEWLNVTFGYDVDALWQLSHEHIMRAGYTWVGISAQRVGLYAPNGLKAWSPRRYAQLEQPQGSSLDSAFVFDPAAYAIYGQALKVLKRPGAVDPLAGIPARWLIATGGSQSAGTLTLYYDLFQPLDQAADGYLPFLLSVSSLLAALNYSNQVNVDFPTLTTVVGKPVFLVNTETDPSFLRLPDSPQFRLWETAGASHVDEEGFESLRTVIRRDLGTDLAAGDSACAYSPRSRIPFFHVVDAALDHLLAWMRDDTPPPAGQPFQYDASGQLQRDGYGNVLGGIRLPQHAVATALNSRDNPGCELEGRYQPFDTATLRSLYPDHADYVAKVEDAAAASLRSGYINPDDARDTVTAAQAAAVPE